MSTTTATFGHGHATTAPAAAPRKSFFQRIVEARTLQGKSRVRATFARMSDSQLADIGFNADQIRHVRATGAIPASFWA